MFSRSLGTVNIDFRQFSHEKLGFLRKDGFLKAFILNGLVQSLEAHSKDFRCLNDQS